MIDVDAHVRSLKRELAILIEERDAMLARRPDNATQAQMRIQYVNKRNEQIQATAHAIHVWTRPGPRGNAPGEL